jgi:hypothetical protein
MTCVEEYNWRMNQFLRAMVVASLQVLLVLDGLFVILLFLRQLVIPLVSGGLAGLNGGLAHGSTWGRSLEELTPEYIRQYKVHAGISLLLNIT